MIERLTAAWVEQHPQSTTPLPDLPHLNTLDVAASAQQVRRGVETTIGECEAAAVQLQRQLDQRRFIVAFLRDLVDGPSSSEPAPVAPVRLRRNARHAARQLHASPVSINNSPIVTRPFFCCWRHLANTIK